MRYLVAVSGGIDSVVMLDMLVRKGGHKLIVAHFDHGIRSDSAEDARFVAGLAKQYGLPFVTKREELGPKASEELARTRRYEFLRTQASAHDAVLVTAHHQDDVIESIAINLLRGTGWRGVAVLDAPDTVRPIAHLSKQFIRTYARVRRLEWVEDSTNASPRYLRNRVRVKLNHSLSNQDKYKLFELWQRQVKLKSVIDHQLKSYIQEDGEYSRHFFTMIDDSVGRELLRTILLEHTGWSPTRPQATRALGAIKTLRSGAVYEVGRGARLYFTRATFIARRGLKML